MNFIKEFKFQKKHIVWLIAVVQLLISAILGVQLAGMNLLPTLYFVLYVVAVLGLAALTVLVAKTKRRAIIICAVSAIVSIVMIVGVVALDKLNDTMNKVTGEDTTKTEMIILVLKENKVESITDLSQFNIGYMEEDKEERAAKVMDELNKAVGGSVNYHEFEAATDMVGALFSKTMDAVIINSAYIEVLAEVEGFTDISERTKSIYSNEITEYMDIVENKDSNLEQFVVYISGIDKFGHVSAKSRSDVNILAVVNTKTKQIQLINTPRDYYVQLPTKKNAYDKLTHAGLYGVKSSIKTLEQLYDIKIDYYIRMNFSGFEAIINALGGIDVYSEYDFTVEPIKHYVKGMNHLNGLEALAFARERKSFAAGDNQRGKNQMAVIQATFDKLISPEIIYNYTEVLGAVEGMIKTNLTPEDMYTLVRMQISDMSPWSFDTYAVTGSGEVLTTYSLPNTATYVMIPKESTVEKAKEKIKAILEAE